MKSIEPLKDELTEEELEVVANAVGQLGMRWAMAEAIGGNEVDESLDGFWEKIEGMTVREVVDNAKKFAEDNEGGEKPEKEVIREVSLNEEIEIDGMSILIASPTIGELEMSNEFQDAPKEPQLIFAVTLQNKKEDSIILVRSMWSNTSLQDEHGNFYGRNKALQYMKNSIVKGGIGDGKVKPKGEATDVLSLDAPLDNAEVFTLIIDPGFARATGTGAYDYEELSSEKFQIKFKRSDIK